MESFQYIVHKTNLLFEPTAIKIVTAIAFSLVSFLFGNLYQDALLGILMLMVFDTILGLMAAYHCGEPITSRRFSNAVLKGIIYFTSISAAYFADLTIPGSVIQSTMIGFVGVTEFISILENIGRLGYRTPRKLLNQLNEMRR